MAILTVAHSFVCDYVDVHGRHCDRRAIHHPSGDAKCFGHWIVAGLRLLPDQRFARGFAAVAALYSGASALIQLIVTVFPALAPLLRNRQPSLWLAANLIATAALMACIWGSLRYERAIAGRLMPAAGLSLIATLAVVGAMLALGRSVPGFLDGPSGLVRYQGYFMIANAAMILAVLLGVVTHAKPLRILFTPALISMIAGLMGALVSAIVLAVKSGGTHWSDLAMMVMIVSVLLSRQRGLRAWFRRVSDEVRV